MGYRSFLKSTYRASARGCYYGLVMGETRDEAERNARAEFGIHRNTKVELEFYMGPQAEYDAEGYCAA